MRILLIVTGLPDEVSPARSAFNLMFAEELKKQHEVTFLYLRSVNPSRRFFRKTIIAGIPCIEISCILPSFNVLKNSIFFTILFKLLTLKYKFEADIIHAVGGWSTFAANIIATRLNKPYIIQFIGSDLNYDIKYLIKNNDFNNSINSSAAVLFESKSLNNIFQKCYQDYSNKIVIYRGVILKEFNYFFEKPDEIRILFLGGMPGNSNIKGGFSLIKAIQYINFRTLNNKLHFVIGGPDIPSQDLLISQITNPNIKISIIGAITKGNVKIQLQKSHIVLIPSISEGLPNMLYEALATGNLVIASKVGGIPEIIEDNISGILIEPNEPSQLADKIFELANDKNRIEQFALNGRLRVESFDYSSYIIGCNKLYSSILISSK
jgi:glycosyltransferase involved in cell wall biosynthesis